MGTIWTPGGEHPVDRPSRTPPADPADPEAPAEPGGPRPRGAGTGEGPAGASGAEPTPEELEAMAQLERELAGTPASVVVANHAIGLFQLAALHLNQRPPNLPEGRLAIDAMAALVEGLAGRLGDEEPALRSALTQLRMAFVQLSQGDADDPAG